MKKTIFTLIYVLLSLQVVDAQGFKIGASGGVNWFKIKFDEGYSNPSYNYSLVSFRQFGYQGGLRLGWEIGQRVSLISDISYIRKGAIWESGERHWDKDKDGTNVEGVYHVNEKYAALHAPLLARIKILGGRFGITTMAGLSFNFHFRGKSSEMFKHNAGNISQGDDSIRFGKSALDDYSKFDMSFILSPGLIYALDEDDLMHLTLDARFDLGMIGMHSEKQLRANGINGNQFHRGTTVNIGFEYCITCYR